MEIKATLNKPYTDKQRLDFIVENNHNKGYEIKETKTALEAWGYTQEELDEQEKARINELFMTRSDFFDGTIMAWGVDEDMLKPLIIAMVNNLPLDDRLKLKALNNFKNALNFYRKHDLFKILVNIPIQLTETIQVTITDEHLDKFFDEVAKGNKETAWQELPQPELIPVEEETLSEVE